MSAEKHHRLRIYMVGYHGLFDHGAQSLFQSARHLAKLGHEVSMIVVGNDDALEVEVVDEVTIYRITLQSTKRYSLSTFSFIRKVASYIKKEAPDIVHVRSFLGSGLLPVLFWTKRKTKWVYDIQTGILNPPLIEFRNRIIGWQTARYDGIIALSEGIRELTFLSNNPKVYILPLGADFELFQSREENVSLQNQYGLNSANFTLVYCGSVSKVRQLDKMVTGFALALADRDHLRLMIIGSGNALQELVDLAKDLRIDEQVIFTGFVPMQSLPDYFSVAHVALAHIPISEIFNHQPPLKTVEYLANSLPVIATDTPNGNGIFVIDGFNGMLINDSPQALCDAILTIDSSPQLQKEFSERARSSVRHFGWDRIVAKQLLPLYTQLLQSE